MNASRISNVLGSLSFFSERRLRAFARIPFCHTLMCSDICYIYYRLGPLETMIVVTKRRLLLLLHVYTYILRPSRSHRLLVRLCICLCHGIPLTTFEFHQSKNRLCIENVHPIRCFDNNDVAMQNSIRLSRLVCFCSYWYCLTWFCSLAHCMHLACVVRQSHIREQPL